MEKTIYQKLNAHYRHIYSFTDSKQISYLYLNEPELIATEFNPTGRILTKGYDHIDLLDEIHIITIDKGKKQIRRFSFDEERSEASYIKKKEQVVKDITGYTIIRQSEKALLLQNEEGFYTYLDYDVYNRSYMLELTPCFLEKAQPFGQEFKGYAKVSFTNQFGVKEEGYINRKDYVFQGNQKIKLYSKEEILGKSLIKK